MYRFVFFLTSAFFEVRGQLHALAALPSGKEPQVVEWRLGGGRGAKRTRILVQSLLTATCNTAECQALSWMPASLWCSCLTSSSDFRRLEQLLLASRMDSLPPTAVLFMCCQAQPVLVWCPCYFPLPPSRRHEDRRKFGCPLGLFILVISSATNSTPITGPVSTKLDIAVAKYCPETLIFVFHRTI
jgi:hypothetical protein